MGGSIVWLEIHRLLILLDCLVEAAHAGQRDTEVVMGYRVARIDGDRRPKLINCLVHPAQVEERSAQGMVRQFVPRDARQRVVPQSRIVAPERRLCHAQPIRTDRSKEAPTPYTRRPAAKI